MTSYQELVQASSRWIDGVAATIVAGRECFRAARRLRLVERTDGFFVLEDLLQKSALYAPFSIVDGRIDAEVAAQLTEILRGAEVDVVLQPHRFLFRPLELPRRAADFLEGIIRAQIDRLTPWSAADAAFGWAPPIEDGGERMSVTIAATARRLITPFTDAIAGLGVDAVIVSAALPEPRSDVQSIKILERKIKGAIEAPRIRRILIWLLAGAGAFAAASIAAGLLIGGDLSTQREDLTARIAQRRAAMRPGQDKTSEAALALEKRKHESPSTVIVVEALSRILPDDTYLSELRIQGDSMQIVGVTADAPALIRLIEQSSHFANATFFAPTTRTPTESGEHFFIEAHIKSVYAPTL